MLRRWCPSARSERPGGENCRARQWFVRLPPTLVPAQRSAILGARLAAIPAMRATNSMPRAANRCAADRCRRRDRQSHAGVSDEGVHHGAAGSRGPTRASLQRAGLRSGKQSKAAFQRNTFAVDHHHPLRALAPLGFSDFRALFFADAKLPSRNDSLQSSCPC